MPDKKIWRIDEIWNSALIEERREIKPRDYIYASEIGKNFWERYQKMMGIKSKKTYEPRVLRKFAAGIWFEEQIGYVLKKAGILVSSQEKVDIDETPEHLAVHGRIDFLAGGLANWDEARKNIEDADFPDFIKNVSFLLIDYFEKNYPDGLEKIIFEVKSVNSQVFWAKKDYLEEAYPWHVFQIYSYLKKLNNEIGKITYISKDDLTMKEILVKYPDEKIEKAWLKDVKQMTEYYRTKTEPPKPESVIFDPRKKLRFQHLKQKYVIVGCWTDNWEVKWSNYFEEITGFKDDEDQSSEDKWLISIKPEMKEKNDVIKNKFKIDNNLT